jgi:apolipoprotein N-acyltransferase
MKNLFTKHNLFVTISAILYVIIFYNGFSSLAWVCLVPLIYGMSHSGKHSLFRAGLLYGTIVGIATFYPFPKIISSFAGDASILGWLFSLGAIFISALFFGGVLFLFSLLKKEKYPSWVNAILLATLWSLSEWVLAYIFDGMPWFGFQMGNLLVSNLYFIQLAEWGGLYLLSFLVVFVNAWAGLLLVKSGVKQLWKPAAFFACYFACCFLLFKHAEGLNESNESKTVSVAIMCENTAPEEKWNNNNGPQMVKNLLALNQQANALKPDVVIWTESAVPWTYKPDDAFVQEVVKNARSANTIQILGINSVYDSNAVYNSAYCILPDGKVSGRYDKRFLLSLAEKPISFFLLPFLNSTDGFYAREGSSAMPLPTSKGNIGVLICNEAFVAASAIDMVRNGADYLVNISNDGWFSEVSFMKDFHFNSARLRAVEVRRDIAVNSNLGISGKIAATGIITDSKQSDKGFVAKMVLEKNNYRTLISKIPNFMLIVLSILTVIFASLRFLFK